MTQYINKSALVAELERRIKVCQDYAKCNLTERARIGNHAQQLELKVILSFLDTLEVKDPYEQCVQYPSIKDGIETYASIYSFNIESQLFPQLTKEQQVLWRKEIEQACISGGDVGVTLARDQRYKENLKEKKVDLDEEFDKCCENYVFDDECEVYTARHFFKLGYNLS
jgi:hypothetical protein